VIVSLFAITDVNVTLFQIKGNTPGWAGIDCNKLPEIGTGWEKKKQDVLI
jgi:hypothetical protein